MDMVKSMIRGSNSQQQNSAPDEASWVVSTLAKVVGTLAGLFGMLGGIFSLITITPSCLFTGGLLILEGLTITLIEAPCFCVFLDFSQVPSAYIDGKPHYIRATLYLLFSIMPFFFCIGFSTFIACSLMLITSGLYLMKALGRKASRSEMAANAISSLSTSPSAILVQNEAPLATNITKPSGLTGEIPSSVTY